MQKTKTVFELVTETKDGKLTVCGGGRYDNLVAEIGGLSYEESCERLFEALEIIAAATPPGAEKQSAVQYVLARLGGKR